MFIPKEFKCPVNLIESADINDIILPLLLIFRRIHVEWLWAHSGETYNLSVSEFTKFPCDFRLPMILAGRVREEKPQQEIPLPVGKAQTMGPPRRY